MKKRLQRDLQKLKSRKVRIVLSIVLAIIMAFIVESATAVWPHSGQGELTFFVAPIINYVALYLLVAWLYEDK